MNRLIRLVFVFCLLVPGLAVAQPDINVSPASLDFGQVEVGQSNTLQITVTNTGNATLSVDRLQFFDNQSQVFRPNYPGVSSQSNNLFTFMDNAFTVNMPIDILAGQSVQLDIVFAPALYGPVSGLFWVYSNAATAPGISYTADGVAPGSLSPPPSPPSATYTISPAAINFGTLNPGQSATSQFTITNTDATNPLNVFFIIASSLALDGFTSPEFPSANADAGMFRSDFSQYLIAPGSHQVVNITFNAGTLGLKSGTLEPITDGTALGPSTISFTAHVVAPPPPAPPSVPAYVEPPPVPGVSFFWWDEGAFGRHFYVTDKLVIVKSVQWNYGDGTDSGKPLSADSTSTAKAMNPLHLYSLAGAFTVTLTMEARLNGRDTTYVSSQVVPVGPPAVAMAPPPPAPPQVTSNRRDKNQGSKMVKTTTKAGGGKKKPPAGKPVAVESVSWGEIKKEMSEGQ